MEREFNIQGLVTKTELLGQILLKKGLVTTKQLEEALDIQKKEQKGMLGEILVEKGFISEELLCAALASQSDYCYIPVERYKISKDILKLVPKDIASKYCLIPLEKVGGVLTIAITNPFNQEAINTVQALTYHKVICAISGKNQIEKVIKLYYQT